MVTGQERQSGTGTGRPLLRSLQGSLVREAGDSGEARRSAPWLGLRQHGGGEGCGLPLGGRCFLVAEVPSELRRMLRAGVAAAVVVALAASSADAKAYTYRKYHEHAATMNRLALEYPTLVKVETAQKKYGLESVGSCPGVPHEKCLQHIVTLTNHTSLALETPHSRVRRSPAPRLQPSLPPRPPNAGVLTGVLPVP